MYLNMCSAEKYMEISMYLDMFNAEKYMEISMYLLTPHMLRYEGNLKITVYEDRKTSQR